MCGLCGVYTVDNLLLRSHLLEVDTSAAHSHASLQLRCACGDDLGKRICLQVWTEHLNLAAPAGSIVVEKKSEKTLFGGVCPENAEKSDRQHDSFEIGNRCGRPHGPLTACGACSLKVRESCGKHAHAP
jgi:hypothetical protein